jgi:hypothetical protein
MAHGEVFSLACHGGNLLKTTDWGTATDWGTDAGREVVHQI